MVSRCSLICRNVESLSGCRATLPNRPRTPSFRPPTFGKSPDYATQHWPLLVVISRFFLAEQGSSKFPMRMAFVSKHLGRTERKLLNIFCTRPLCGPDCVHLRRNSPLNLLAIV